jgi:hypothetical protein
MRTLLRRLACSRSHRSNYAVACADCGVDMGPKRFSRDSTLVWLLGGAVLGCVTMLLLAPQG